MATQQYETATLSEEFAQKIQTQLTEVSASALKSDTTERLLTDLEAAVADRNGIQVADTYKQLRSHLHAGGEDDSVYGSSIISGRKKQTLLDVLTPCSVVYGYVYPDDSIGSRNVPADHVFADLE